jgi:two-component system phosphate regulon response regulator OmpR
MGEVRYDIDRGELWRGDTPIRLTATEAQLMRIFAAAPGQPVTRDKLAGEVAEEEGAEKGGDDRSDRAVDVQITRLRRKIEADPKQPRYLQTVRGAGYMLAPD